MGSWTSSRLAFIVFCVSIREIAGQSILLSKHLPCIQIFGEFQPAYKLTTNNIYLENACRSSWSTIVECSKLTLQKVLNPVFKSKLENIFNDIYITYNPICKNFKAYKELGECVHSANLEIQYSKCDRVDPMKDEVDCRDLQKEIECRSDILRNCKSQTFALGRHIVLSALRRFLLQCKCSIYEDHLKCKEVPPRSKYFAPIASTEAPKESIESAYLEFPDSRNLYEHYYLDNYEDTNSADEELMIENPDNIVLLGDPEIENLNNQVVDEVQDEHPEIENFNIEPSLDEILTSLEKNDELKAELERLKGGISEVNKVTVQNDEVEKAKPEFEDGDDLVKPLEDSSIVPEVKVEDASKRSVENDARSSGGLTYLAVESNLTDKNFFRANKHPSNEEDLIFQQMHPEFPSVKEEYVDQGIESGTDDILKSLEELEKVKRKDVGSSNANKTYCRENGDVLTSIKEPSGCGTISVNFSIICISFCQTLLTIFKFV